MLQTELLQQIVNDYLQGSDYYLVDLQLQPGNRIVVEIDSFAGVPIDYCVNLSRHIESKLNRDEEDYELEVGSSGLTEPFKVLKHYEKNLNKEVEVLTKTGKKLSGILVDVQPESFSLRIEKMEKPEGAKRKIKVSEDIVFSYQEVKTTKYIYRFK